MLTKPEQDLIGYQDKVNQHVCVHCKNPLPEGYNFVLCRGCLDKRNSNARELRAYRKIHNLCTVCGKRDLFPTSQVVQNVVTRKMQINEHAINRNALKIYFSREP